MPRRNSNVVQTRDEHRMDLTGADGLPLRVPGRRVSRKTRRKGCAV
ncbi:hypothetical protein [Streptomyces hokutonensis]|uniref:Uncharacterized protein n=1 Tax=Streptomyces hokutonensis TaxID=1306990 RepID=A0ABW6M934_9ACTN